MTRSKAGKPKPELSVQTMDDGRIVVTQKRAQLRTPGKKHYARIDLTADDARFLREQLRRHIVLLDALERSGLT